MTLPRFDTDDLAARLDALRHEEIDQLPFGVIKLDGHQRVQFFSATEASLSGRGSRPVLGLDFFREVAPCMNTETFRGRVFRELTEGTLDLELGHTGDFSDSNRFLRARVMSAADGGLWLANERP